LRKSRKYACFAMFSNIVRKHFPLLAETILLNFHYRCLPKRKTAGKPRQGIKVSREGGIATKKENSK
jgi:hypothetical protein